MDSAEASTPVLKRILLVMSGLLVVAALYVAWTFYSRTQDAKKAEQEAAAREQQRLRNTTDLVFGSGEVKILTFGLSPAHPHRGEAVNLCYGVSNAVSVTLEPHVEDSKPSYNHCLQVTPLKDTTYTLTARDAKGKSVTESLTVQVR